MGGGGDYLGGVVRGNGVAASIDKGMLPNTERRKAEANGEGDEEAHVEYEEEEGPEVAWSSGLWGGGTLMVVMLLVVLVEYW